MVSRFAQLTYARSHEPVGLCAACGNPVLADSSHITIYNAREGTVEWLCQPCHIQVCLWAAAYATGGRIEAA